MTGVQCPECGRLAMYRAFGIWQCNHCQKRSKHAHRKTLLDHFRMGNKSITNKECRNLLHLQSRSTATRILKASQLTYQPEHQYWIPKEPYMTQLASRARMPESRARTAVSPARK